jgi:hypothetical protein
MAVGSIAASVVRPRQISALRMDGEVSTATGHRRITIRALTGRHRRIMAHAPDRRRTGLPRRAIADMAPRLRQATVVRLRTTGPILLRTQRRDTRRRALRAFLLRDRSRRRITRRHALKVFPLRDRSRRRITRVADIPLGSQRDTLPGPPVVGTRAEAAGAGKIPPHWFKSAASDCTGTAAP